MKIKRWIAASLIAVVAIAIAFMLFLPPLAQWYIEKHAEEWTGRRILMDRLHINLFRASIGIDGLKVYERNKKDVFFSADTIYVNAEWRHALNGEAELIKVSVAKPYVQVIQHDTHFNYDDLVTRFTAADTARSKQAKTEPVKYWIRNIAVRNGEIKYVNKGLANEVKVIKLQASCPVIAWDNPKHHYKINFSFAEGGDVRALFDLALDKLNYKLQYDMKAFSVAQLYPYLKDYINVKAMNGSINADLNLYGNFNEPEAIATRGTLALNDFSIKDPNDDELVGLGKLGIDIDTLNIKSDLYNFGGISLEKPFFKFELFDEGNNFSKLVNYAATDTTQTTAAGPVTDSTAVAVEHGNVLELLANYVHDLSEKYTISNYKADSVTITEGTLIFNDYTLNSRFNYFLENLYAKAEGINSNNSNISARIASILNKSGKMRGEVKVNPDGFRDMEITYAVTDLKITDFNPYSDYYVAHPFVDGTCYYTNKSTINNRFLVSENKLEIRKIMVGKKVKNKTAVNLPIRFAVALLRDKNGNILLDVPVKGNLDDPKYRLGPVIWQIFKNLIAKAVAAPGKLLAKRSGVDEKYLEGFEWQTLQADLNPEQMKALDAAAKTLESSPEMNVEFIKAYNLPKERDELALKESKKRFLFFSHRLSSADEVSPEEEKMVDAIPPKDSVFNAYVDNELKTEHSLMSIFEKSKRLVGTDKVQGKLNQLMTARTEAINKYLIAKGVDEKRFRIVDPKEKKEVPYEVSSRTVMNFYMGDGDEGDEGDDGEVVEDRTVTARGASTAKVQRRKD